MAAGLLLAGKDIGVHMAPWSIKLSATMKCLTSCSTIMDRIWLAKAKAAAYLLSSCMLATAQGALNSSFTTLQTWLIKSLGAAGLKC